MNLGSGEYLMISTSLRSPYKVDGIITFLTEITMNYSVKYKEMTLLKIAPDLVNYEVVWEGVEDTTVDFSFDLLNDYVFSSLDLLFENLIPARINVMFLDEKSYEVSISFNFTELLEEEKDEKLKKERCDFIEKIALILFRCLGPIYGVLGVERSVSSLNDISEGLFTLPSDKVFFNNSRILNKERLYEIINGSNYIQEIENLGVYFRMSDVDDFYFVESEELRIKLANLIKLN